MQMVLLMFWQVQNKMMDLGVAMVFEPIDAAELLLVFFWFVWKKEEVRQNVYEINKMLRIRIPNAINWKPTTYK